MPNKFFRPAGATAAVLLFAVWAAVHVFLLPRDLPSWSDGVPDAIPVDFRMNAADMMRADTCKYGPLQYILLDAVAPALSPDRADPADGGEALRLVSGRILAARLLSAFMQLGTAFLIFLFGMRIAGLSRMSAALGSLLFLLAPLSVFYSGTSNMDMPYTFWFTAAVFAALHAEEQESVSFRRHLLFHLLAGVFLACSFCTKDQVYALILLPAAALLIRRFRLTKRLFHALRPGFLWAVSFLPVCFLIYSLCGGIPMMRDHFRWITGAGSVSYAQFGSAAMDRLKLTGSALADTVRAMDPAVLLFAVILTVLFFLRFCRRGSSCGTEDSGTAPSAVPLSRSLLLFPVLAWISFLLFFVQVVRYCHSRYLLALLPFVLTALCILLERLVPKRSGRLSLAALFLIFQALLACWLVRQMTDTPIRQIRALWAGDPSWKKQRIATMTAEEGIVLLYFPDPARPPEPRKKIRHGSRLYTALKEDMPDLFPTEPYMEFLAPGQLLLPVRQGEAASSVPDVRFELAAAYGFQPVKTLSVPELPSWMTGGIRDLLRGLSGCLRGDLFHPDAVMILARPGPPVRLTEYPVFAESGFNEQLLQLTDLLPQTRPEDIGSLHPLGRALRPFSPPDPDSYLIHPKALVCCYFAYREAGRKADADALAEYMRTALPEMYEQLQGISAEPSP